MSGVLKRLYRRVINKNQTIKKEDQIIGKEETMTNLPKHYERVEERGLNIDEVPWVDFPEGLAEGGVKWKLLNVAPEVGSWTAIFSCPAGSSFASHHHIGPGEYYLTKGKIDIRGGEAAGGETLSAPAYGYESCEAFHGKTNFPVDSEFYMTFLGPLNFVDEPGGPTKALVTWSGVQAAWEAGLAAANIS
jgi:hypothetical protein